MKAEFLQAKARENPKWVARAFHATLVDFGYSITQEKVVEFIQHWQEGLTPKGGPEMFVHNWLKEGIEEA